MAENETAAAFGGEVEIEIAGAPCAITPSGKFLVEVESCAKVVLPKCNQLAIPVTNSGKNPLPIEVKWSGNTVARGSAWLTPKELVIFPDLKTPEIHFGRKPYEWAKVTVSGDRSGYSTTAHIDFAAAGFTPMTPFLFEMSFYVNALGTAHGRIRQSWQGAQDLWSGQSRFVLAVPYVQD